MQAVARTGSALRAAQVVHLSQPAVTRAIQALEAFCGLPLFDRGGRGMVPTPLGRVVAQRAARLFAHLAAGAQEAAVGLDLERGGPERFAAAVTPASLRAALAVSAMASESGAASVLGISQPAVHRSLAALEYLVGCTVFLKSARGTRLTEAGQALVWRVKLAMAEARALQSDIDGWRGKVRGRVVIGALPLSVALVLPQAVHQVRLRHPEVEITVVDGAYDSLLRQLLEADIDLMVGALREPTPELRQEPLVDEALAIVARPGHPCLQRSTLRLADLLAWEWVVPLPGTPASRALHRVFAQAGLNPPPATVEAGSAAFTRALVACSDRLALTSLGQALDDTHTGVLARVPFALPGTSRPVGLTLRAAGEPSPDLRVVLEALREAAKRTPIAERS